MTYQHEKATDKVLNQADAAIVASDVRHVTKPNSSQHEKVIDNSNHLENVSDDALVRKMCLNMELDKQIKRKRIHLEEMKTYSNKIANITLDLLDSIKQMPSYDE